MVDPVIANTLQTNLGRDEKLLWTGKPQGGLIFRNSDYLMLPFTLMWGGFAIFWEIAVSASGAPFIFRLWGIPFVLVGLYMIFGRFFWEARKRASTSYGITDNRIIIVSGIFNVEIKSLNIRTLSDVTVSQEKNGKGTITLGPVNSRFGMFGNTSWPGIPQAPKLDLIEDVMEAYDLILKLQRTQH